MNNVVKEKKLWTQQEVADYFRVVPATVKNWRERNLLTFFQVPGSSRVLYPFDAVEVFEKQHTKSAREVVKPGKRSKIKRNKPVMPSNEADWRV